MCLAVPGKLVRWIDRDPLLARAEIEFAGVRRICHMACVPDVQEGQFVLIHAGIAIATIDEAEATRLIEDLAQLKPDR